MLRVKGDTIALHAMRWDDEIRDADDAVPKSVEIADYEVDAAIELIEGMTIDDLEGPEFTDHYREALAGVTEAKQEGKPPPKPEEEAPPAGQVVDLMAALQQSVEKAQASCGEPRLSRRCQPGKRRPRRRRPSRRRRAGGAPSSCGVSVTSSADRRLPT